MAASKGLLARPAGTAQPDFQDYWFRAQVKRLCNQGRREKRQDKKQPRKGSADPRMRRRSVDPAVVEA
jgi:hypothetical protein